MGVRLPLYPRRKDRMEVSITDISDVEKEIQIRASAEELIPHFDEAYRRFQPTIEFHGFRKGKVPLGLLKKVHGESIEYKSLDTIASTIYRKAIEERNIHPIGDPVLVDIDYKRGEALNFKIKYEVKPIFDLREYKGITVERTVHRVTDKELEEEILRLRRANSTLQNAETASDDEHIVTADIQQLDEGGAPLIGKKNADVRLYLADETLASEIRDGLRNASAGQVRRVTMKHDHDGKPHTESIELAVKKVERVALPAFDDALAAKITKEKVRTVDEFRRSLRTDLEGYWRERTERKLADSIIGEIVRRHDVTVPESLVNGVLDSLVEELKNRSRNKTLPPDFDEAEFRKSNRGYAIFQAKWFLVRERIIEAEKISAAEDDLQQAAEREASKLGIEKDRLLQYYHSSSGVKDRIVSDKLMAFLIANQNIKEVVTEGPID